MSSSRPESSGALAADESEEWTAGESPREEGALHGNNCNTTTSSSQPVSVHEDGAISEETTDDPNEDIPQHRLRENLPDVKDEMLSEASVTPSETPPRSCFAAAVRKEPSTANPPLCNIDSMATVNKVKTAPLLDGQHLDQGDNTLEPMTSNPAASAGTSGVNRIRKMTTKRGLSNNTPANSNGTLRRSGSNASQDGKLHANRRSLSNNSHPKSRTNSMGSQNSATSHEHPNNNNIFDESEGLSFQVVEQALTSEKASIPKDNKGQRMKGSNLSDNQTVVMRDPAFGKPQTTSLATASGNDQSFPAPPPPAAGLAREDHFSAPGSYAMPGPATNSQNLTPDSSVGGYQDEDDGYDSDTGASLGFDNNLGGDHSILVEATLVADREEERGRRSSNGGDEEEQFGGERSTIRLRNTSIVVEAKPIRGMLSNRLVMLFILIMILVIVGLAVGLGVGSGGSRGAETDGLSLTNRPFPSASNSSSSTASPTATPIPTLQRIQESGILRCGYTQHTPTELRNLSGFDPHQQVGEEDSEYLDALIRTADARDNFTLELCRAIAWAVNGENATYEAYPLEESTKYEMLLNGTIDVIVAQTFLSMERDLFEPTTGEGFSYSNPFFVTGLGFAGLPHSVQCAEDDIKTVGNCSGTVVCVVESSSFKAYLEFRIPHGQLLVSQDLREMILSFSAGTCNVIVSKVYHIFESMLRSIGYRGDFATGTQEVTRELHTIVSKDDDSEWADYVNTVILGLLSAEERGITQELAEAMGEVNFFGEQNKRMLVDAVRSGGNMGNLYDNALGWIMPRLQRNFINNGTTGLLLSSELGSPTVIGPGPSSGGTLESIMQRGYLKCGIRSSRPGFALFESSSSAWHGLDVDYCAAIASSIFQGRPNVVEFVNVSSSTKGFDVLNEGEVDLLTGSVWTIQNDAREPWTKQRYSFTKPYFYGPPQNTSFDENLCLATRQDDPQWSSFVYWVTDSLVYAEEQEITQGSSSSMPLVNLFGMDLSRMFRDAIYTVGNYAQVYERNVAPHLPRGGRNTLTLVGDNTPIFYVPPGF